LYVALDLSPFHLQIISYEYPVYFIPKEQIFNSFKLSALSSAAWRTVHAIEGIQVKVTLPLSQTNMPITRTQGMGEKLNPSYISDFGGTDEVSSSACITPRERKMGTPCT
jgi:hypothetical protein